MNAQLPKLKPRDVFFIALGVCLIVLVLWYFMRFQARQLHIQELQSNIDTSSSQLSDLQTKQSELPGLRTDVRALQDKQDVFVRALPSTVRMGQVIRDIQDSVGASGGKLDGVTVQSGTEANLPAGVQSVNLNVSLQGQFAPIFRTLRSVETMGRFSKVTSVNMTLPAPNAADPLLNGVVNMTVYTFDPSAAQPAAADPASGTAPAAPAAPAAPTTGGNS